LTRLAVLFCGLLLAGGPCLAQSCHSAEYLCGGSPYLCGTTVPGVWLVKGNGSATSLFLAGNIIHSFCMDVDNRKIVFAVGGVPYASTCLPSTGPDHGLYRYDPGAMTYETIYGPDSMACFAPNKIHVDQNGDYVFSCWQRSGLTSRYCLLKADRAGTLTTVLSTASLGHPAFLDRSVERNIDTGHFLVSDGMSRTSPTTLNNPIHEVAADGTVTTWSTGGKYGWIGSHAMPQDHGSGAIEGPHDRYLFQVKPGTTSRTILATLRVGTALAVNFHNFKFDLQSAAAKRWVGTPSTPGGGFTSWIAHLDRSGSASSIHVSGLPAGKAVRDNDFAFYRGNHIASLKTGKNRWDLLLSCPRSPGRAYAIAASISGVRPAAPLPDGRRINLVPDAITTATLNNWLPGIWNPGPLILDANGEARGFLDLSSLPVPPGGIGMPVWIAMAVLDPGAPWGVKYLPDTIVIRI